MVKLEKSPQVPILEAKPAFLAKSGSSARILVIEDNLDSVHTLVYVLRRMGHVVDYAINGYAGLALARELTPDFVLLDIGLPGLDGYAVCDAIKAEPSLRNTKIVVITAYGDEQYRKRSQEAGCHVHLVKPVPISVLEAVLT